MTLKDVINIINLNDENLEYLTSIEYDGDPESFKLCLEYSEDDCPEDVESINVYLCCDGSSYRSVKNGGYEEYYIGDELLSLYQIIKKNWIKYHMKNK